jgi:hypothetical protein
LAEDLEPIALVSEPTGGATKLMVDFIPGLSLGEALPRRHALDERRVSGRYVDSLDRPRHSSQRMERRNRRWFARSGLIPGLGLLSGCGILPSTVSPARKLARIGHLWAADIIPQSAAALRSGLGDLGYVEGRDIHIDDRVAGGRLEPLPSLAAELLGLQVDIIVTTGTPATLAARAVTDTLPIVQASGTADLVREGVAASVARPGGNVTGPSSILEELAPKQLELLRQIVPGLSRRVAVLWNPTSPSTGLAWAERGPARRQQASSCIRWR